MRSALLALLLLAPASRCFGGGCETSAAELDMILALDYKAFDQTAGKGAREYAARGCYLEAARLTDLWHLHHLSEFPCGRLSSQATALNFHAGQLYAEAGKDGYGLAVARLRKALVGAEGSDSPVTWNAYVAATIAFLKSDLEELKTQLLVMKAKKTPEQQPNIDAVNALVKCFGRTYLEAYSAEPSCRAEP